jgi:O-antigen/teichoic acid export membrane protein
MSSKEIYNNKKIAKNTIALYLRTIFVLLVTLYTSRIVLNVLGVEDYGVYNVIGGIVAMLQILSGSISMSISRYLTYEIGRGNENRLSIVFSTSKRIMQLFAILVLIVGEIVGIWFINHKLNIPIGRLEAANFIFQFSLVSFCVNVISIPYNACIIAHERMTAYAYFSIIESILKLIACFVLIYLSFDKLILYGFMQLLIAVIIRVMYSVYCNRSFKECRINVKHYDRELFGSMGHFAGWTVLTYGSFVLNTQGLNILMNIFFGVVVNASRAIATSVEGAIMQFVNNFLTAVYPQITKTYAAEQRDQMYELICRGAKFAYFLLLIFALPMMLETEFILKLWLKIVPEYAVSFFRLTMIVSALNCLGNTATCACQATGKIKLYSLSVSALTLLVFPCSWIAYKFGSSVESAYYIYIIVNFLLLIVKILMMRNMVGLPSVIYLTKVLRPIVFTTFVAIVLPYIIYSNVDSSWLRFILVSSVCIFTTVLSILFIGMMSNERVMVINMIRAKLKMVK